MCSNPGINLVWPTQRSILAQVPGLRAELILHGRRRDIEAYGKTEAASGEKHFNQSI